MNYLLYPIQQPHEVVTPHLQTIWGNSGRLTDTHQAIQMAPDRARMGAQEVGLQDQTLLNTQFNVWFPPLARRKGVWEGVYWVNAPSSLCNLF